MKYKLRGGVLQREMKGGGIENSFLPKIYQSSPENLGLGDSMTSNRRRFYSGRPTASKSGLAQAQDTQSKEALAQSRESLVQSKESLVQKKEEAFDLITVVDKEEEVDVREE